MFSKVQCMDMKTYRINGKFIELRAILFSILIHFFLIELLILTFPSKHFIKNPPFVFLGSILERQDLSRLAEKKPKRQAQQTTLPVSIHSKNNRVSSQKITNVSKPLFSRNMDKTQKNFIKSHFLEKNKKENSAQGSREEFAEKMGIETDVPEYKPLSLY